MDPADVAEKLSKPGLNKHQVDWQFVDLRQPKDFAAGHIPRARNIPLATLGSASIPSPFADATVLEAQWLELEDIFTQERTISKIKACDKEVIVICYGGDTARVATSIMREKGIEASSVRGGFAALMDEGVMPTCSSMNSVKWCKAMLWRLLTSPLRLFSK
jgi:rhodanese-related sulfurtransferase